MINTLKMMAAAALLAGTLCMMGGCGLPQATPELDATATTSRQQHARYKRIMDNNTRGIWDDLDRMFFLEENLRLTPYPMP